jgi:hypothetical protein
MATGARKPRTAHGKWWELAPIVIITITVGVGLAVAILNPSGGRGHHEPETHKPEIKHVENADIVALPSLSLPRLELAGKYVVKQGEFLTTDPGANAPEGFLFKAVKPSYTSTVTTDDDEKKVETTVETRPASIFEAEPAGKLIATPTDFEDPGAALEPYTNFAPGATEERQWNWQPAQAQEPELLPAALHTNDTKDGFLWPFPKAQVKVKCKRETQLPDFRPDFKPEFNPRFELEWNGAKWWKKRIETADASMAVTLVAKLSGTISASFECTLVPQTSVPIFAIAVPVGAVPVPVRVDITGALTGTATAATSVIDDNDPVRVEVKGSTTIKYDGERVTTQRPKLKSIKVTVPRPRVNNRATLGFRAKPGLAIEAGWRIPALGKAVAVAEMRIGTGVDLKYDEASESLLKACVPLELEGGFYFHLPGKEWGKEGKPYPLRDPKCWPVRLLPQDEEEGEEPTHRGRAKARRPAGSRCETPLGMTTDKGGACAGGEKEASPRLVSLSR